MFEIPESIVEKTRLAINGDDDSLGTVFQYYRPRLLAHSVRICGNTTFAQDAVQDTFIAAFTHLNSLKNVNSFYPWLKRILVNICYRQLNRGRTGAEIINRTIEDNLINSIDIHYENISNNQKIYELLRFLSEDLRACVLLRYFSSYNSYELIAIALGIPVGTVRSRLSAARIKLTELFTAKCDAGDDAILESKYWSEYYFNQWSRLHKDLETRNEFFNHLNPKLKIRFTSGLQSIGRNIIEKEIDQDLVYGTSISVKEIASSGNVTVLEADNINTPEFPNRCAPSMVIVLFREKDLVHTTHIFDSARPQPVF